MSDDPLEQTQDVPQLSTLRGVWIVTRFYGYNCAGQVRAGPPNPPECWLECDGPVEVGGGDISPGQLAAVPAWTGRRAGKTSRARYRKG